MCASSGQLSPTPQLLCPWSLYSSLSCMWMSGFWEDSCRIVLILALHKALRTQAVALAQAGVLSSKGSSSHRVRWPQGLHEIQKGL